MPDVLSVAAEVVELALPPTKRDNGLTRGVVKMLVVRAHLNGAAHALRLLVDTGSSTIIISDLVAEEIPRLGESAPTSVSGPVMKSMAAQGYLLDSIGVRLEDGRMDERTSLELLVMPLPLFERDIYHGYLGMNWRTLFSRVCFRFDLDPPRLELHLDS